MMVPKAFAGSVVSRDPKGKAMSISSGYYVVLQGSSNLSRVGLSQ